MKAEGSLRLAARAMSALLRLPGGRASLPAMLRNASFRIPELGSRRGSDMRARGERLEPRGETQMSNDKQQDDKMLCNQEEITALVNEQRSI